MCSYYLLLSQNLFLTITFYPSPFSLKDIRSYNSFTAEVGLQKVEIILQKQKQKTRRSKLNETLIVLKKQKFEDLQTKIFIDVEGCRGHPKIMFLIILIFSLV
jgi:hypothetical protein